MHVNCSASTLQIITTQRQNQSMLRFCTILCNIHTNTQYGINLKDEILVAELDHRRQHHYHDFAMPMDRGNG